MALCRKLLRLVVPRYDLAQEGQLVRYANPQCPLIIKNNSGIASAIQIKKK